MILVMSSGGSPREQEPPLVFPQWRDVSKAPSIGYRPRPGADGTMGIDTFATYAEPGYLAGDWWTRRQIVVELTDVLNDAGGLPAEVGAPVVHVVVEVGDAWRTVPEVGDATASPEPSVVPGTVRPVVVGVPDEVLRPLEPAERLCLLTALTATAVAAVLPQSHPARAVLTSDPRFVLAEF
jgi:hypothetical protein